MPARLRAFISSTMEDLGNERRAVAAQLQKFNIEPVNAEELSPDGSSSWVLLEEEIKSCQLFILISGRSYGWVPTSGPGAGRNQSVTHMEAEFARKNGLIILPFFLKPRPGEKEDDETRRRDKFRRDIQDWNDGYFRQMFEWADELADRVGGSVSTVLGQALRRQLESRSALNSVQQPAAGRTSFRAGRAETSAADLHSIIANASWVAPQAVLLAGAGMSIAAGYPNAAALKQLFLDDLKADPNIPNRLDFAAITETYQERLGRQALTGRIEDALRHSDTFGPTRAHVAAVRVFSTILTTNFDLLFEAACRAVGIHCTVITPSSSPDSTLPAQGVVIFKIDGSIETPESLVLTPKDISGALENIWFWNLIGERLKGNPLIVIGHALQNATAMKLLPDTHLHTGGAYVTPFLADDGVASQLHQFNLVGVKADADSFMISYEQAICGRKPTA